MTVKIYLEDKLVKTKYFQRSRQSKETISNGLTKLQEDFSMIDLPCYMVIIDNRHTAKP